MDEVLLIHSLSLQIKKSRPTKTVSGCSNKHQCIYNSVTRKVLCIQSFFGINYRNPLRFSGTFTITHLGSRSIDRTFPLATVIAELVLVSGETLFLGETSSKSCQFVGPLPNQQYCLFRLKMDFHTLGRSPSNLTHTLTPKGEGLGSPTKCINTHTLSLIFLQPIKSIYKKRH